MPFTLLPEVGESLGQLFGPSPPWDSPIAKRAASCQTHFKRCYQLPHHPQAALLSIEVPPPAVGDITTRRATLDAFIGLLVAKHTPVTDVTITDFATQAADGASIICRWYTKNNAPSSTPTPAVVYAHGGGMIALSLKDYDQTLSRYVSRTGTPFLSIDHRLSPEIRAPTQVTDTYAGLQYLVTHATSLNVDPSRIGIMGDSGGGGITASLAHYIKLKGGPAVKKQILIYPMLDDRNVEADENIAPFATWTYEDNRTAWDAILGEKRGAENVDPIEAAGRMTVADARGLPPAYIDVGEIDIFRDEDMHYANTLSKAGVECEFHLFPGANHAWESIAPEGKSAKQAMDFRCAAVLSL